MARRQITRITGTVRSHTAGAAAGLGSAVAYDELICIPVSQRHTNVLREWWGDRPLRRLGVELPAPEFGQYNTCGLDRVCAGLAAVRRHGACLVIDAGTAVTITAWQADDEKLPVFKGGMIMPGPRACLHGLTHLAPALPHPQIEVILEDPLQHSTDGALQIPFACYPEWVRACTKRVAAASGISCHVASGDAGEWLPDALRARPGCSRFSRVGYFGGLAVCFCNQKTPPKKAFGGVVVGSVKFVVQQVYTGAVNFLARTRPKPVVHWSTSLSSRA